MFSSRSGSSPEEVVSNNDQELMLQEIRYITSNALIYWRKPAQLGGGKKTFVGISDVSSFGVEPVSTQRIHTISSVQKESFVLTTTSLLTSIKIVSNISNKGIVGTPIIYIPPIQ